MTRRPIRAVLAAAGLLLPGAWVLRAADDDGWTSIFNGQDLTGWTMIQSGHGTEAIWEVIDGAIVGRQNPPGAGGLLGTEQLYGNFEVSCEIMPQWPMDSGLFLRGQEGGKAYQVTIDFRGGGEVGTLYAEGCGGWLKQNPDWRKHWKEDEWNSIRARIEGNPPHIQTWLNGEPLVDFTDDQKRLPDTGHICVQVHRGEGYKATVARFRKVKVRPLD